jgi:hypothetical protein
VYRGRSFSSFRIWEFPGQTGLQNSDVNPSWQQCAEARGACKTLDPQHLSRRTRDQTLIFESPRPPDRRFSGLPGSRYRPETLRSTLVPAPACRDRVRCRKWRAGIFRRRTGAGHRLVRRCPLESAHRLPSFHMQNRNRLVRSSGKLVLLVLREVQVYRKDFCQPYRTGE